MSGIILALSGEPIILKNMLINVSMAFAEQDQSGQTSSTTKSEQGVKAKELKVTGLVDFETPEILTKLYALGEAKDAGGGLQKYRIANILAQAVNFREATFSGTIETTAQADKMAWQVGFTLKEHVSVSEKRQARAGKQKAQTQSQGDEGIAVEDLSEPEETRSWFEENVLKPANDALGGE
ncbi:hypothetical protein [Pragia fontium]|uniref:Uncharacterized protein n=1 Tax=Pragia fontium DSM 5563 = ATCC 49100 TaxID=1122977 RepID=A0AAJ5BGM5_9GAMM|nr:hypothetical protein [Pragia fontium]SFC50235.1 hypothetical protein SAMN02745723_102522 [Pragia fontium DSM 5563 = ATCC 49100]